MGFPTRSDKHLAFWAVPLLGLLTMVPILGAQEVEPTKKKYDYAWESLATAPVAPWFDDGKFGIFIHWGPYSVMGYRPGGKGYAEQTPKEIYRGPEEYYPWMKETYGANPPEFGYKDIIPMFKAEKWNPDEWAELFKKSGARYVVLTAEHHDGYAMWDSELTDWCATKIGPKRDLVGDLAVAVRKTGLKYATSYHRERHPSYYTTEKHQVKAPAHQDILEEIQRMPSAAGLYGPFEFTDAFIEDYVARWKELQDKYQPDFMWIDDVPVFDRSRVKMDHPQTKKFLEAFKYMIADYLNAAEDWDKDVYLNNKGARKNWPDGPGCREKDNLQLDDITIKWQNPATFGTSFGYMKWEEENEAYRSSDQLIQLLVNTVSKNGNLLLNIGPRADGMIPQGMQIRLLEIGKWLEKNGESIYGTRPWKVSSDGPAPKKISKHEVEYTANMIRYTASKTGDVIYATQMVWGDGTVSAEKLASNAGLLKHEIKAVSLLGYSDAKVEWKQTDDALEMSTDATIEAKHPVVWRIELK